MKVWLNFESRHLNSESGCNEDIWHFEKNKPIYFKILFA